MLILVCYHSLLEKIADRRFRTFYVMCYTILYGKTRTDMEKQAKRPNVIIIDDDQEVVDCLSESLCLKGVHVLGTANDGIQAVKLYAKLKPDIVIMDVMMPKYDGFYGVKNILEINPDAKIIMISGNMSAFEKKLRKLNVSAIISKPYYIDEIIEIIGKVNSRSLARYR